MKNIIKKPINFIGIIWSLIWIYLILIRYSEQSIYLYISEFAVIFSTSFLSVILLKIKENEREILSFIAVAAVLSAIFAPLIYFLSKNYFILIYFGLSIIFNLINFYFLSLSEQISSFNLFIKNMIFLVLSGVIGFGVLSIIVYHIFKALENILELFGFELIRFGPKKT